jgi:hypothetical protein
VATYEKCENAVRVVGHCTGSSSIRQAQSSEAVIPKAPRCADDQAGFPSTVVAAEGREFTSA